MTAFDSLSQYNPARHGPPSDRWQPQPDFLQGTTTNDLQRVQEHRDFLARNVEDGPVCSCCGQGVNVIRVLFGWKHAMALDTLIRALRSAGTEDQYVRLGPLLLNELRKHNYGSRLIQALTGGGGPATHLRWYGCIESRDGKDGNPKTRDGVYRLTQHGRDVFYGKEVPAWIYTYNKRIWQVSESVVTIDQAWGRGYQLKDTFPVRRPLG